MILLILITIALGLAACLLIKYTTRNYDVFEKKGIKYIKPFPLIGNSQYFLTGNVIGKVLNGYFNFPEEKIVGMFEFTKPLYFVRSPHLIKQLAIKDFPYFQDHNGFADPSVDDLFSKILFVLSGKEWRDMRSSLSPMFTGSKMRVMLELINNCTKQFTLYLREEYQQNGSKPYRIKDLFSRYANDVIATCAFGIQCDSLKNKNNEFYQFGQNMLKMQKPSLFLKFFFMTIFPTISKILGLNVFPKEMINKFNELIIETMRIRKEKGIIRPDMLQLLMKLKEGQSLKGQDNESDEFEEENKIIDGEEKKIWTDKELIAQCFQFFFAGFDTGSTIMSFMAYELAVNEEIQSKLIEEIDEINESLAGNSVTYEILHKLKYMDMVLSEVLRKWPPLLMLDRKCVKNYSYKDGDGQEITIEKGDIVWLPCYPIHRDPKYFPDPEKFDPERFNDENKNNIELGTYIPFGIGPRSCIASRFAQMEIKALFFQILLNFQFKVCKETEIPLKLKKFGMVPEKEIKLLIEPRNKIN